jgi:hypothetical protein
VLRKICTKGSNDVIWWPAKCGLERAEQLPTHGIYAGRIDMVLSFRALPPNGPKLWAWDWPALETVVVRSEEARVFFSRGAWAPALFHRFGTGPLLIRLRWCFRYLPPRGKDHKLFNAGDARLTQEVNRATA